MAAKVVEFTSIALNARRFAVPTGCDHLTDYDLSRVSGRGVDLTVATTRLIAGGVLDRFPDLKIVMTHSGGGIAAVKDRL